MDEQRNLSYSQFNAWANRLAWVLKADGVKHGTVVAVMLENRLEQLALLAALAKLGAIAALISTTQRGKVLSHSLNLAKPSFFVIGEELFTAFSEVRSDVSGATTGGYWLADRDTLQDAGIAPHGWKNLAQMIAGQRVDNLPDSQQVNPKDPCFYIYTSGTTGMPKASITSHGKWIKAYGGFGHAGLALENTDVLCLTLPLYHSNAVTVSWGSALAGGAALAVRRKFSASTFWKDVAYYNATCFAKSEAAILRNVFKKGDAWYNTGDLMRNIGCKHAQFVDRLRDTFRWKGENVSTTEVESLLGAFTGVEAAVVYGVEIPETNGRCGMAALRMSSGANLDPQALALYLDKEMPAYAAPLFIRRLTEVETTGTFKYKKTELKQLAYDPEQTADPLLVRSPGSDTFQPLDSTLYGQIQTATHRV
jgi:acyl-CoA synthetase (AMP-forming)/AMP-acid ligase II